MVKYNKQNSKKVQDVQNELNGAEVAQSDGSAEEEVKEVSKSVYTPSESDILNYTFRFGMYKGQKAIDVVNKTQIKVSQLGYNYTDRTGYKYIKFLIKEVNLLPRDITILNAIIRKYYVRNNPQSN